MKRILLLVVLLCLSSLSALKASHFYGVALSYEHLGGCMYRIYQTGYYDCGGVAMNGNLPLNSGNPFSNLILNITGNGNCTFSNSPSVWVFDTASYVDISPLCPGTLTGCTVLSGGNLFNGVAQARYYTDISLCGIACSSVLVTYSNCCRNYPISSGAGGEGLYSEMLIPLNTNITGNHSPQFISPPAIYIAAGISSIIQQQAFDADGDSLVYSLAPSMQAAGQMVSYSAGYSPTNPLGPTWNVSVNAQTGEVSFIPSAGAFQIGVMTVKVDEYRNGGLIGSINRDAQITVVNNTNAGNVFPTSSIANVTGGIFQSNPHKVTTFPNTPISFDIMVNDANIADVLTYTSDFQDYMPNATLTGINGVNPMILHFSWTPSVNDTNKHFPLFIHTYDSHCPLYGSNDILVNIEVDNLTFSATTTNSGCVIPTGAIDFSVQGGIAPFSYSWSNGATTQDLSNIPTGAYWVNISDTYGNSWTSDTFYVNPDSIFSNFTIIPPSCNANDGSIDISVTGGNTPYNYLWSNGQTSSLINNLGVGGYSVTVTDALGCYLHKAILLDHDIADSCFSRISGNVFFDANQNCTQDVLEMGFPNVVVLGDTNLIAFTDINGNYSFTVQDTGTYHLQCYYNASPFSSSNCLPVPFNKDIHISSLGIDSLHNDFAIHVAKDISISLSELSYAPGFSHHANISCHNSSYYNLDSATVNYQYDSVFQNLTFSLPPNSHDTINRIVTWILPNFNVGASQNIAIYGVTALNATLGNTAVSYASILPTIGDIYPNNNQDTASLIIIGSFDPNNKEVYPQGETQYGLIAPTTQELAYTINFQNTGNYPAQFVVIKDTIEADKLVNTSLILEAYSHACVATLEQDSILTFTFANINLPDSTSDEPNSHGFVKYKIKMNPNLPLNVPIHNRASIYFDFNVPVLTNTVMSTLYAPLLLSVNVDSVICPKDSLSAWVQQGNPPYVFSWSNGVQISGNTDGFSQVSPTFSNGIQSVQVTDNFGVNISQSFHTNVQAIADANFTYYHIGNDYGFVANSPQNTTYFWDFGNGQNSTQTNPFVHFTQSGAYNVSLVVTDNCGGSDTIAQVVYVALTDLDNGFSSSATLSPNPFAEFALLSFSNFEKENYTLIIRDLTGREVQKIENIRTNEVKIERINKAKGTYIWELTGKYQAKGLMVVE